MEKEESSRKNNNNRGEKQSVWAKRRRLPMKIVNAPLMKKARERERERKRERERERERGERERGGRNARALVRF